MASILKVKDANGNIVEIPAIRGPRGPQGPAGPGSGDMNASVYDPTGKAQDVFKYVDDKVGSIPTPDVSGQISTHNTSTSAHNDIRKAVSDHTGSKNNPHGVTAALVGAPTVAEMNAAVAGRAPATHNHAAGDITSGILAVARGGTGVGSLAELATALVPLLGGAKVVSGSYTGTGNSQSINVGFKPKLVYIFSNYSFTTQYGPVDNYAVLIMSYGTEFCLRVADSTACLGNGYGSIASKGFTLNGGDHNMSGKTSYYVAIG